MVKGALASTLIMVARGWTQVAAVAMLLVAGRFLDIASFGEFAVASALTVMLSQWVGVGCYERVLNMHGDRRAVDNSFLINSLSALVMVVAGLAIGLAAEQVYSSATIGRLVLLLAPLALFAGWRSAGEAAMLGDGRFTRYALTTIAIETVALGAGIAAIFDGQGTLALVVAKYIQFALGGPAFIVLVGRLPRLRLDRGEASAIYRLWRSLIVDRVLSYFQNYSADLLLGALLSPAAAGVYRISIRIVSLVNTIIADPLRSLAWTILGKAGGAEPRARVSEAMIGAVFVLLCGPLLLLALVGGDLAVVALGPQWAPAGPVIALLALAALVMVPSLVSEAAFGASGAIGELPRQRVVFVGVALVLMVAAAPWGVLYTAASQLAASLVALAVVVRAQRVHLGIRVSGYAGLAAWSLAAALGAGAAAVAAGVAAESASPAVHAALELSAGLGAYLLLVLGHPATRATLAGFGLAVERVSRGRPAADGPSGPAVTIPG